MSGENRMAIGNRKCLILDRELLSTLHGSGRKVEFLAKIGVRRRNWLVFSRHYGFEDGTAWSYGRLAKHYRISEQRVGQIVSSVVDKIREYARAHKRARASGT